MDGLSSASPVPGLVGCDRDRNDPGGPGAQWLRELGDGRLVDQVVLSVGVVDLIRGSTG